MRRGWVDYMSHLMVLDAASALSGEAHGSPGLSAQALVSF